MTMYNVVKTIILEYVDPESESLKQTKIFECKDYIFLLPHETLAEKKFDCEMSKDIIICKNNMWICKKYREAYQPLINENLKNKIAQIYLKQRFVNSDKSKII